MTLVDALGVRFETAPFLNINVSYAVFSHNVRILLNNWERLESKGDCTTCSNIVPILNPQKGQVGYWCEKQCQAVYCSEKCKKENTNDHKQLCPYYAVLLSLGTIGRVPAGSLSEISSLTKLVTTHKYTAPTATLGAYKYDQKHDKITEKTIKNAKNTKFSYSASNVPNMSGYACEAMSLNQFNSKYGNGESPIHKLVSTISHRISVLIMFSIVKW
jgi:hypothetical protein